MISRLSFRLLTICICTVGLVWAQPGCLLLRSLWESRPPKPCPGFLRTRHCVMFNPSTHWISSPAGINQERSIEVNPGQLHPLHLLSGGTTQLICRACREWAELARHPLLPTHLQSPLETSSQKDQNRNILKSSSFLSACATARLAESHEAAPSGWDPGWGARHPGTQHCQTSLVQRGTETAALKTISLFQRVTDNSGRDPLTRSQPFFPQNHFFSFHITAGKFPGDCKLPWISPADEFPLGNVEGAGV